MTSSVLVTHGVWNKLREVCGILAPMNVSGVGDEILLEWEGLTKNEVKTVNYMLDSIYGCRNLTLADIVDFNNELVTTNQHITLLEALWYGEVTCWETNSGYINYKGFLVLFELEYPNIKCYFDSHWIDVPMAIVEGGR